MLKTISAALLAFGVLAAPALAATSATTTPTPPVKSATVKLVGPNSNNGMAHYHHQLRHHRAHKSITALRTQPRVAKVAVKPVGTFVKRG